MSIIMNTELQNLDNKVKEVQNFDIPSNWKELVVKYWKEDANRVNSIEDIPYVLTKWNWLRTTSNKTFKTIVFIMQTSFTIPAFTIRQLIGRKIMIEDLDPDLSETQENTYIKAFSRALDELIECGLVDTIHLTPEEVGRGKRTVTIFIAPFAKVEHIEKCKKMYLNRGGLFGIGEKKSKSKSLKEWAEEQASKKDACIEAKKELNSSVTVNECPNCKKITTDLTAKNCDTCTEEVPIKLEDKLTYKICPSCKTVYSLKHGYCTACKKKVYIKLIEKQVTKKNIKKEEKLG